MHRFSLLPLLALALAVSLAACDTGGGTDDAAFADTASVESTFNATATTPAADGTAAVSISLSGSVDHDEDVDGFRGAFKHHPIVADDGNEYFVTLFRLRAHTGESIMLGRVSPERDLYGTFDVEAERNLEAPYGYVAAYKASRDDTVKVNATSGTVTIEETDRRAIRGTFDLVLEDSTVLEGTFIAVPGRRIDDARCQLLKRRLHAAVEAGEMTRQEALRRLVEAGCVREQEAECRALRHRLHAAVEAGEITREEALDALREAGCAPLGPPVADGPRGDGPTDGPADGPADGPMP